MDYNQQIDEIKLNNNLNLFNFIKEDCKDEFFLNKVNDLIIYYKNIDKKTEIINTFESNIQERLCKFEDYAFRKPWNKLSKIQKENKLKEFINNYFIEENDEINSIKKNIMNDFNFNKLNSAKIVNYESFNSKIIGISKLSFNINDNKYIYKL